MAIFIIILLSLILRLISLNQSLWWDEAINVVYAKSSSFWYFVTEYPVGDFHPPGWFALLWIWTHIFGFSEISSRLPSVILGTATVWLTYLLGKKLLHKRIVLLAAIFLAISPLHVYYSQEARMYVFACFAATLSFYFLIRLISKNNWFNFVGFVVALVLVFYSDYLAYLIVLAQIFYLIWVKKVNRVALLSFFASGITLLPWLKIFPQQLKTGLNVAYILPGWAQVVGGGNLKDLLLIGIKTIFGRVTIFDKTLYTLVASVVGVIFGSVFILGLKKIDQSTKLLISWIFVPVILAFLISFFVPILAYFRMIFILPAFYLILAKGIESLPKKFAVPIFFVICLISLVSLFAYYFNPKFQREDWKSAIHFVSQNMNNQTIVIFENNEVPAPARYYGNDLSNFSGGLSENLVEDIEGKNQVFLFEYLVDIYDPNRLVEQKLKNNNFIEIKKYDFSGVGFVRLYTKL